VSQTILCFARMELPTKSRQWTGACQTSLTGEPIHGYSRTFSREFKLTAVKKAIEQGLSRPAVAKDLGIRDTLIRKWKNSFDEDGIFQAAMAGNRSTEAELKRLREENRQLKIEPDILKKTTAFFAKESH